MGLERERRAAWRFRPNRMGMRAGTQGKSTWLYGGCVCGCGVLSRESSIYGRSFDLFLSLPCSLLSALAISIQSRRRRGGPCHTVDESTSVEIEKWRAKTCTKNHVLHTQTHTPPPVMSIRRTSLDRP
ncbi:hypothetical protein VTJ04DRAFT_4790 [Mycothermus thermophilus]|uniref:uncharacterized protein n=1 Tax=Humicola insolens TaxID=85995 RepID=UPI003742FCD6